MADQVSTEVESRNCGCKSGQGEGAGTDELGPDFTSSDRQENDANLQAI